MDCTVLCYTISLYVKHHQEVIGDSAHSKEGTVVLRLKLTNSQEKMHREDDQT